jgi:hypothetical protein
MPPDFIPSCYLIYCIHGDGGADPVHGLAGVQERNIETVSASGLCATVSVLRGSAAPIATEEITRYGRIVASCHRTHTTIPMRYGSVFKDKPEIAAHLEAHGETYKSLLEHLTGCDEMGIRLLLPESPAALAVPGKVNCKQSHASFGDPEPPASGTAYLRHRKERYDLTTAFLNKAETALSQWRGFFHKLSRDCRWERPRTVGGRQAPILSMCFLVRRQDIADFRKVFDRISRQRPEKSMLSGPWPPYSFVRPEQNHAGSELNLGAEASLPTERNRP